MHLPRLLVPLVCLIVAAVLTPAPAQNRTKADKSKPDPNKDVKTSDIRLGKTLMGKLDDNSFEGRVVLLEFWGIDCPPCRTSMPKASSLHTELSPFGLVVVGAHAQKGTPDKI